MDELATDDPTKPGNPIEALLMQQANEAIRRGKDPKAVTEHLGVLARHLRSNPHVRDQANAALSAGKDPSSVSQHLASLASAGPTGNITLGEDAPAAHAAPPSAPSTAESALSGAAQGSTFGFADEVLGGIGAANALLPKAIGGEGASLSDVPAVYRRDRDKVRNFDSAASDAHGKAHLAGGLAGGLLPIVTSGGASAASGLGNVLKQGALYGALQGAGAAKSLTDIPEDAAIGGGVGAVGGAVLHGLGKGAVAIANKSGVSNAVSKAAGALAEKVAPDGKLADFLHAIEQSVGDKGAANRTVNQGLQREGKTPQGVLTKLEQNVATSGDKPELLGDYSPETLRTTKSLTKTPGSARSKIVQAIKDRNAGTRGRVLQDFTQGGRAIAADPEAAMAPGLPTTLPPASVPPTRPVDPSPGVRDRLVARLQQMTGAGQQDVRSLAEQEVRDRATSGAALFGAAHDSEGVLDTPESRQLLQRPVMQSLWQRAQRAAANRGEELPTVTERVVKPEVQSLLAQVSPDLREGVLEKAMRNPENVVEVSHPVPNARAMHYMDIALAEAQKGFESQNGISRADAADARAIMDQLRPMGQQAFPELATAKADYATRSQSIRAYKQGLSLFKQLTSAKAPEGAVGAGDPLALKAFRSGIDGLEASVRHMAPEDVPRFRQAAQHAVLEKLQGVAATDRGSTAGVLRSVFGDGPEAVRWQRLLFDSPEQAGEFQQAIAQERQGLAGFGREREQYRTNVQGFRAATTARRTEEKLIGRAQAGNPEAEATLAGRLPGGGAPTLRRLAQGRTASAINAVPADLDESTTNVLKSVFPNSPADEDALKSLFPDRESFGTFRSALGRERGMAASSAKLKGSDTAENLSDQEARKVTSLLSHLLHPVRALKAASSAIDKAATDRANTALGEQLGGTGADHLRQVLADLLRSEVGDAGQRQVGNAIRNTAIPHLPFVGASD